MLQVAFHKYKLPRSNIRNGCNRNSKVLDSWLLYSKLTVVGDINVLLLVLIADAETFNSDWGVLLYFCIDGLFLFKCKEHSILCVRHSV